MVHVSTMADDYYRFIERAHILRGENTRREYRLGDKVTVQVIRVDLEQRQIDLGITEILEAVRAQRPGRGRAPKGGREPRGERRQSPRRRGRPGPRERQARRGRGR
jgi:ribonuclease R